MPFSLRYFSRLLVLILLASGGWSPPGEAIAQDRIYISSVGTHEIRVYDAATGEFDRTLDSAPGDRDQPQEVLFGPDGMLYVTFFAGDEDHAIHRFDPDSGDYLGTFSSGYTLDAPTKMRMGPDGNFYVSQWGQSNFNVAVFDGQTGEFIREATNDATRHNLMEMAWDEQGRLYVSHWGDGENGYVRRFDSDGNVQSTVIDSSELQGPVNIWFNEDGTLNVVDWSRARVDAFDISTGEIARTRALGNGNFSKFEGWTIGPDGYLYVCDWQNGEVNRYDSGTGDFVDTFIRDPGLSRPNSIKFGPAEDVSSASRSSELPEATWLAQNYPNPFNPATTIRYAIEKTTRVSLVVYDLFGREVAQLVNGVRPAGEHKVNFDAVGLPSGNYLVRLEADRTTSTRVMTLLR